MFAAPRERVFAAFTEPELLKRWLFGKPGGALVVCDTARKAGDSFRYVWRDPDGSEMGMSGVCLEIKRPERIVATEKWDQPWYQIRRCRTHRQKCGACRPEAFLYPVSAV